MEAGGSQRIALGMRPHNIYFFETQPSVALNGGRGCPSSPSVVKAEPETGSSGLVFRAAAIVGLEDFKNEIALEERIGAMINAAVKRLVQNKAMKQMLRTSSAN